MYWICVLINTMTRDHSMESNEHAICWEDIPINNSFSSCISLQHPKRFNCDDYFKKRKMCRRYVKRIHLEHSLSSSLNFQVGEITMVEDADDSTKFFFNQVKTGIKIQLVGGNREIYVKDDFLGEKIHFITIIKKSEIRGIMSNGMILCTKQDKEVEALFVNINLLPGTVSTLEGDDIIKNVRIGIIELNKSFNKNLINRTQIKGGQLDCDGLKILVSGEAICNKLRDDILIQLVF